MKQLILSLSVIGALLLSSCSTLKPTDPTDQTPRDYTSYASAGALIATTVVLESAKTQEDKEKKKEIIRKIVVALKLADDGVVTIQELEEAVGNEVAIKGHWQVYIKSVVKYINLQVDIPHSDLVNAVVVGLEDGLKL